MSPPTCVFDVTKPLFLPSFFSFLFVSNMLAVLVVDTSVSTVCIIVVFRLFEAVKSREEGRDLLVYFMGSS